MILNFDSVNTASEVLLMDRIVRGSLTKLPPLPPSRLHDQLFGLFADLKQFWQISTL
jgi:hypothetical protein